MVTQPSKLRTTLLRLSVLLEVNDVFFISKGPTFATDAKAHLFQWAEVVGRDVAQALAAKKANDYTSVGLFVGDLVSIVLWNETNN